MPWKRERKPEKISEVIPECVERLSDEMVEIVSPGYVGEEPETEPAYPDREKELEYISFVDAENLTKYKYAMLSETRVKEIEEMKIPVAVSGKACHRKHAYCAKDTFVATSMDESVVFGSCFVSESVGNVKRGEAYLLIIGDKYYVISEQNVQTLYQGEENGIVYLHFGCEISASKDVVDVNWFHILRQSMAVYLRARWNREVKLVIDLVRDRGVVDGYPRDTFVKEEVTEEHKAYLLTILSDLTHLKYGFWVDKKSKTYFYGTGSQVHDGLEFYSLLYKGESYYVATERLNDKEYRLCVQIQHTNKQGEDVYEEIKAVVSEVFRCMYGYSPKLCFPDNPKYNSLRSNM